MLGILAQSFMVATRTDGAVAKSQPPAARSGLRVIRDRLADMRQIGRERQQLADMDGAQRKDVGLSEADVWRELQRPFWDTNRSQRPRR